MNTNVKNKNILLTMTGLFAAMITLMTAYLFHIPYGANGGYVHFGDGLIYLCAVLLPTPYAMAAAAIGGGLADLLTAPMWAPATIMIKMLMVLFFTDKTPRIFCLRNLAAPAAAAVVSVGGYYLAEGILFGSFIAPFAAVFGNIIQALGSTIIFFIFALAFDRTGVKNKLRRDGLRA